ncbi:MAG TPA: hypothetical protein VHU87_05545 [Rhizomicrobium sp.]|nr:hypothetical protein [Rhizomicrobium sp.]
MTEEQKPAGAHPAIEVPSRETMRIAREAMAEEALQMAEERARREGNPLPPEPDEETRKLNAMRELKRYLRAKAAQANENEQAEQDTGVAKLRQADRVPPLSFAPELSATSHPQAPDIRDSDETEALLNGLIAECHFLMREVAFRTICDSRDPLDRLRFLEASRTMMKAGASVGKAVARLRNGDVKEVRQSFRHEDRRAGGASDPIRENNDQDVGSGGRVAAKAGSTRRQS